MVRFANIIKILQSTYFSYFYLLCRLTETLGADEEDAFSAFGVDFLVVVLRRVERDTFFSFLSSARTLF